MNAATGLTVAEYAYGPFGEPLRATGLLASDNPFRFSTKYLQPESGLLDYGHRFYKPSTGRWPNRDPIGEEGGINLYGFTLNNPINTFDSDGRNPGVIVIGGGVLVIGGAMYIACWLNPDCRALLENIGKAARDACKSRAHPNEEKNRECQALAQKQFDRTSDECDKLTGKARDVCHKQALDQLVQDLRECNRQFPLTP